MSNGTDCSVQGCDRTARSKGWCSGHAQRVRRNGEPGPATFRRSPGSTPEPCTVEGCDLPQDSRGYCKTHYSRWYYGTELHKPVKQPEGRLTPVCAVTGCLDPATGRGWCNRHYQRWWRTGETGPADIPRYGLIKVCSAMGCDRAHRTKGYCDTHYRRWKRGVPVDSKTFRAPPKPMNASSYAAVHMRLAATWGPASDYACCWCGEDAHHWAYQHNDPEALYSATGAPYSLNIGECYEPMCRQCHGRMDNDLDMREAAFN